MQVVVSDVTNIGLVQYMKESSEQLRKWTQSAARGECGWICSSCCCEDKSGMPDECFHGQEWCTKIIKRDKGI